MHVCILRWQFCCTSCLCIYWSSFRFFFALVVAKLAHLQCFASKLASILWLIVNYLYLIIKYKSKKNQLICGVPDCAPFSFPDSAVCCDMVLCWAWVLLFGRKGIPHIPAGFEQLYVCILNSAFNSSCLAELTPSPPGAKQDKTFFKTSEISQTLSQRSILFRCWGDMEKVMGAGHL